MLPFKLERTDETLTADGGLAFVAEYPHAWACGSPPQTSLPLASHAGHRFLKTALIGSHGHLSNPYLCFWKLRKGLTKIPSWLILLALQGMVWVTGLSVIMVSES